MSKLLKNTSMQYIYRLAEEKDTDDIVALVESAYRGEKSKQGWTSEAYFINGQRTDAEEVSSLMCRENSALVLCFDNDELLATIQIQKNDDECYLGMFAVQPQKQSSGIGSMLLKQAENYAQQQWSCRVMRMLVISIRQELIEWYQRKGYRSTGEKQRFPYHEPRFGLPARDDLMLDTYEKQLTEKIHEEKAD